MEIGETIAYYRKQKGLSQERLAELANTDNSYLSRIETGRNIPSLRMLQGIAAVLGVPALVLLHGKLSVSALAMLSLLEGCTEQEQAELCANLTAMKEHMHKFR